MNLSEFIEKVRDNSDLQNALDELVIDAKLQEATELNNSGAEKQANYLIGFSPSEEELDRLYKNLVEGVADCDSFVSDEIVVWFRMENGEGEWPLVKNMSDQEIENIARICSFKLAYDPYAIDSDFEDVEILSCEVLYDGITFSEELQVGLRVKNDELVGSPAPIIKFKLSKPVAPEEFLRSVWNSSVRLLTKASASLGHEECYTGDEDGNSSVLDVEEVDNIVLALKEAHLFVGKTFGFDQMSDGISIGSDWLELKS